MRETGHRPPPVRSLRVALGASTLWLLAGAALMPSLNESLTVVKLWSGALALVAAGTLALAFREVLRPETRPAGVGGLVTALVLGAAAALLCVMATPPG